MTFNLQGTGARVTPPDSHTIIRWTFDEPTPPFQNSGTGAALSLTAFHGTPTYVPGLFGPAIGLQQATLSSGPTSINEVFTTALTVSIWVRMIGGVFGGGGYAPMLMKEPDSSNSFPYDAFAMWLYADGTISGDLVTGATRHGIGPTSLPYNAEFGGWSLAAQTYDGANHCLYLNGDLVGSLPCTGNIDYSSHGPWVVGGYDADISGYNLSAAIDDIRVENTVRSQAYLRAMYKLGVGLP